ncbi:histone-like nucleoid-structuring protein Lsr2 [Couchioplanes caeruleus]|uniref:Nucleoid-associated protein Lsr2 n=2 Tax=Couchioplanes caeruleus TaxID=56438 RepID=A0A1K0FNL9_9ACTN|nr:Lsr2 family protein [Couchioplanes caeruleus]OJF14437.1 nucleoid-associated protein Lsr2 [Couchioplanes caeruleus subsp. caeruleus]ROP34013.1 Lsr2 protein [Couchioplanes caeruleus]
MARQVITVLTDDLDGGSADRTVEFGLDGRTYTIDLSETNAGILRTALRPFLSAATPVGRGDITGRADRGTAGRRADSRSPARPRRSGRDLNQMIRDWACEHGYAMSGRGRVPLSVVEAFHRAH